ncbi:MAG: radical SAM protein [Cocleimonas sp.]|nr:radical SAM protein [Cocleimonas sp.]
MKILLLTPPMTQLNTPYPATAYLTGFLRQHGYDTVQRDMAIELLLLMLTQNGLDRLLEQIEDNFASTDDDNLPDAVYHFFLHFDTIRICLEPTLQFLQGKNPSLALRIVSRKFLPEGANFENLNAMQVASNAILDWAFGELGTHDKAKYLATLFLDDLVDVIREGVDPYFEISRYGERLAASNPSFDDLYRVLSEEKTYTEIGLQSLLDQYIIDEQPDIIGITVPFPGNMLGALQIAKHCRQIIAHCPVLLGGGYINTELRQLKDPRLFEFVDYILLDDGERPLLNLLDYLQGTGTKDDLVRTYYLEKNQLTYSNNERIADIPHKDIGTPCYDGLPLERYLSLCEMLNPMHRIWSDGRWNKLTIAHGCYWSKCSFCDVNLDYIGRYDDAGADIVVQRMEALIAETGQTGFHFVDEAAPPKVLFAMAEQIIEKGLVVTWWGNIRFEKTFTPEKCQLLADSGCIAISGGLEVASDRLLKRMKKGVTVQQVARVTKGFSAAGILVHAYLMYGFPTQTEAETLLSLEYVRQLMQNKCFHSAYWHRFSATVHSPVGQSPTDYQITLQPHPEIRFANNDIAFIDPVNTDHERLGKGLKSALYNYMHGLGLDQPLQVWFDQPIKTPQIAADFISLSLK